jgi:hypothetical protein
VYTEATISTTDAQTLAVQLDFDVARVQQDYGRVFAARPRVYVLATTATYLTAQTTILQIPSTSLSASAGVFFVDKVAVDWSRQQNVKPLTVPRHELTHMMIRQIAPTAVVPAWLNEGSARLEEFTVAGSQWWQAVNRYGALSMTASGQLLALMDLVSQTSWNQRGGSGSGVYQYYEGQQAAQFLRDDIGLPGVIAVLTRMSQGQTYDQAYLAVSGMSSQTFATAFPARLAALASSPGITLTADSPSGTGLNGPGYVLYGYVPNSTVTLNITGAATGVTNTNKTKQVDQYGVYVSSLGSEWPADTYTFTVTAPNLAAITKTFTKTP